MMLFRHDHDVVMKSVLREISPSFGGLKRPARVRCYILYLFGTRYCDCVTLSFPLVASFGFYSRLLFYIDTKKDSVSPRSQQSRHFATLMTGDVMFALFPFAPVTPRSTFSGVLLSPSLLDCNMK